MPAPRVSLENSADDTILERERMSLKWTTIAQVLKTSRYATGIFGKWHLGDAEPYQPQNRAFDEVFIHGCGGIGQEHPGPCSDAPGNTHFDPMIRHNDRFERTKGYFISQSLFLVRLWRGPRSAKIGQSPFRLHNSQRSSRP